MTSHPQYAAIARLLGNADVMSTLIVGGDDDPHLLVGDEIRVYHPAYSDVRRWEVVVRTDYTAHRSLDEAAADVVATVRR